MYIHPKDLCFISTREQQAPAFDKAFDCGHRITVTSNFAKYCLMCVYHVVLVHLLFSKIQVPASIIAPCLTLEQQSRTFDCPLANVFHRMSDGMKWYHYPIHSEFTPWSNNICINIDVSAFDMRHLLLRQPGALSLRLCQVHEPLATR